MRCCCLSRESDHLSLLLAMQNPEKNVIAENAAYRQFVTLVWVSSNVGRGGVGNGSEPGGFRPENIQHSKTNIGIANNQTTIHWPLDVRPDQGHFLDSVVCVLLLFLAISLLTDVTVIPEQIKREKSSRNGKPVVNFSSITHINWPRRHPNSCPSRTGSPSTRRSRPL